MNHLTFAIAAGCLMSGPVLAHEIVHGAHTHAHGPDCGHDRLAHEGHMDYLHDGHLHHVQGDHVDEHALAVTAENPADDALVSTVAHGEHAHTLSAGAHPVVQHGDHFDFIHDGRLHFVHGDHVDDHGPVTVIEAST
ncbi:MAG: hypothetical protein ACFB2Z_05310 [Maricaulaceae bacterium]